MAYLEIWKAEKADSLLHSASKLAKAMKKKVFECTLDARSPLLPSSATSVFGWLVDI
jgi:hypothetical protein